MTSAIKDFPDCYAAIGIAVFGEAEEAWKTQIATLIETMRKN